MTEFAAVTDPGRRDGVNQDAIGWDTERQLWFVADGMGGHARGELASRLVKETLLAQVPLVGLAAAILKAHEAIRREASQIDGERGMGSTVVCAQIADRACQVVWVGDSRAYLWRRRELQRLTRDHSFLELLRETENLSETELRNEQGANAVTQALGMDTPEPSETTQDLRAGDWIILCSDGLPVELRDGEIAQTLASSSNPEQATRALLAAAIAKGGRDNISIIIIQYDGGSAMRAVWRLPMFDGRLMEWLAGLTGVLVAVAIAMLMRRHGH
jgi:PPM family protein phosphatase